MPDLFNENPTGPWICSVCGGERSAAETPERQVYGVKKTLEDGSVVKIIQGTKIVGQCCTKTPRN